VFSQKNMGISGARNTGLKHAFGEYLMFIDNDDFYEPEMCECMVSAIEKYDADFAVCDINGVMASEEYAHYWRVQRKFGLINLTPETINDFNILVWDKIFKKELCDKYSITFPDGLMYEDFCFCCKYFSVAKKAFALDKKLYNYFVRADSATQNITDKEISFDKKLDLWYCTIKVLEFMRKNNLIRTQFGPFYENFLRNSMWMWKFLNEDQKNSAVELMMQMFNEDELALLNSRLLFVRAIKSNNKELLLNLFDNNMKITPLAKIFSVKRTLTHKVVRVLGLKLKFREVIRV
jgi:glycosyltransferase involved in cell wall biosynthesis